MGFTKDNYYRETIVNLSVSGETVAAVEFEDIQFQHCSFVGCTFEKCRFIHCTFTDSILSAANPLKSSFSEVKFLKCKVIGCDWAKVSRIQELDFTDCQVNYSNFSMLKLPGIKLVNCQAKEADFSEADLTGGTFTGTDFERSIFNRTNLTRADLKGAFNYSIDPRCNTLKETRFSLPEAIALLNALDIIIE